MLNGIADHEEFGMLLESIEWAGARKKGELVNSLYDESGEGRTKKELKTFNKGRLIALHVNQEFGGDFDD
jgi:hypothetical protein